MRTFFALDKNKKKIKILNPLNVQWNRSFYSTGSFSIQLSESEYSKDFKFIYRDGGSALGVIQKFELNKSIESGTTIQISGNMFEGLLNNMPVMPFDFVRQIDDVSGILLYYTDAGKLPAPTGYARSLITDNIITIFAGFAGPTNAAATVQRACRTAAQLAKNEYPKFLNAIGITDYIYPFDDVDVHPMSDDVLEAAFDPDKYVSPEDDDDLPDTGSTTIDDQGRTIFTVEKGSTQYLGDLLRTWIDSTWQEPGSYHFTDDSASVSQSDIPPHRIAFRSAFDPQTQKVTLDFGIKTHVSSYEFSDENENIKTLSYSQDVSAEPAGGIARAVYLTEASANSAAETESGSTTNDYKWKNYRCKEQTSKRDKYKSLDELPIDPTWSGSISVECDYLGNTFEDLITESDCIKKTYEMICNFDNSATTVSYTLTPIIADFDDDYENYYHLGDFVKVDGVYRQIVEINEVVKDGGQQLTLTLDAEIKNVFQNYYNFTHSLFSSKGRG
jgi:hypothetical protein